MQVKRQKISKNYEICRGWQHSVVTKSLKQQVDTTFMAANYLEDMQRENQM